MRTLVSRGVVICGLALVGVEATPSLAASELITNGDFNSTYSTGTQQANTPSQLNLNGYGVTGWTSSPSNAYTFLFNPNLSGSAGYTSNGQYGDIQLYTSQNGGGTTLGAQNAPSSLASPVGGDFIALSGAFQTGPLSQTLGNLSIGGNYILSFYWAAVQQAGFQGQTTESLGYTFGNQSYTTATVTTPSTGFTPWTKVSQSFTATATSQTLSFLAAGGPSGGQEPFTLLDGVSLVANPSVVTPAATPEPSGIILLGTGLVGIAGVLKRRLA